METLKLTPWIKQLVSPHSVTHTQIKASLSVPFHPLLSPWYSIWDDKKLFKDSFL